MSMCEHMVTGKIDTPGHTSSEGRSVVQLSIMLDLLDAVHVPGRTVLPLGSSIASLDQLLRRMQQLAATLIWI